ALLEIRLDSFAHELSARSGEQQRLGRRRHLGMLKIQDDPPDQIADPRAARLAGQDHRIPANMQLLIEQARLRALAAAFGAFKCDKQAHVACYVRCPLVHVAGYRSWRYSFATCDVRPVSRLSDKS